MADHVAVLIWLGIGAYASVGAVVTIMLLSGAVRGFDKNAAAAPLRVKFVLAPGMIALWPILVTRLFGTRPREDLS